MGQPGDIFYESIGIWAFLQTISIQTGSIITSIRLRLMSILRCPEIAENGDKTRD